MPLYGPRQLIYRTAELAATAVADNVDGAYECYLTAQTEQAIRDLDAAMDAMGDLYQRLGKRLLWTSL